MLKSPHFWTASDSPMQIRTIWQIQQVLSSQILLFQVLWLLSECINLGILASIHQGYPFISTLIQSNIRTTHIVRNIHILIHYKVLSYSPRFPDVSHRLATFVCSWLYFSNSDTSLAAPRLTHTFAIHHLLRTYKQAVPIPR